LCKDKTRLCNKKLQMGMRMSVDKPSIYVDFQNCDSLGRVRLNTVSTVKDVKQLAIELQKGLAVHLYCMELEADGIVDYSQEANMWVAIFNVDDLKERKPGAN
jgi:hypothetical protein